MTTWTSAELDAVDAVDEITIASRQAVDVGEPALPPEPTPDNGRPQHRTFREDRRAAG